MAFENFGTLSGYEALNPLSGSDPITVDRTPDFLNDVGRNRSFSGADQDYANDTPSPSKGHRSLPASDLTSILQADSVSDLAEDDFTMSFMLDLVPLAPTD
jgi:hypothetical protein